MKLLLLSFYYPPDLSAGSFRSEALVRALRELGGAEVAIDVITTMPNRYASHRQTAPSSEMSEGVNVRRIPLRSHQGGMRDQSRAFIDYAWAVEKLSRGQQWDVVVASSSRLMTAALGARIARRTKARLYLDIRDLFTDTMADVLARSPLRAVLPVLRAIEHRTLRAAHRINVVSPGFLPHVRTISGCHDVSVFTNGIDDEFLGHDFSADHANVKNTIPLILYAGNIGEGQGLEHVVPRAASLLEGKARFRIVGDGGRRYALEKALALAGVSNVELCPPVARARLINHYRNADVLFLHLNDHTAFRKVLPSKLFEYGATGKPILAGVAGQPADFVTSELSGAEVFPPCDASALVAALDRVLEAAQPIDRTRFCQKYARTHIMRQLARDIIAIGNLTQ